MARGRRPWRSARPATKTSYLVAASRSSTVMPDSTCPGSSSMLAPWCLESTDMAFLRLVTACTMSFSSSLNLAASVSLISVAWSSDAVFSWISCLVLAISAESLPKRADRSSISAMSAASLASASAMAWVFSLSFVSHQHTILSYISESLAASASNSDFILFNRLTTRFTGFTRSLASGASNSLAQACSKELSRASRAEARAPPRARSATIAVRRAMAVSGGGWGFVG
mmetsp:Transcript_98561/g.317807  ORF Transcript_98561/g.317807 Transcript_98561/m.317807 type:complete len:228 (+) Transcript_98561:1157-1840(+)